MSFFRLSLALKTITLGKAGYKVLLSCIAHRQASLASYRLGLFLEDTSEQPSATNFDVAHPNTRFREARDLHAHKKVLCTQNSLLSPEP